MNYVSLHKGQLLDSLENKVLYADFCGLVIGQKGIGKSFFIEKLASRLEGQVSQSQIDAVPDLTYPQLEQSVSMQLGLRWQDTNESLLERITSRIEQRVLLTIDNAHLLSPKCLEKLLELVDVQLKARETHLFIVMTGETSLAEKLNQTEILKNNPNCCVVFELQPIQLSETKYLVAEFQDIDVGTTEALYDEQQLEYLWQLGNGVPIELGYQLNRWLSEKKVRTEPPSHSAHSRKYWISGGYAFVAILLTVMLYYQDDINDMISSENDTAGFQETLADKSVVNEQIVEMQTPGVEESETPVSTYSVDTKLEHKGQMDEALERKSKDKAQAAVEGDRISGTVTSSLEPEKDLKPLAVPAKKQESKSSDELGSGPAKQPEIAIEKTAIVDVVKAEPSNALPALTEDERRLVLVSDDQFTLQWVVVSSLKSATLFRKEHPLSAQMSIFRRAAGTGYLFFVVSGQYNSAADAENAKTIYEQRKYPGTPWMKSFKAVKVDILALQ